MQTFRILYTNKAARKTEQSWEIVDFPSMLEANRYAVKTYGKKLLGITDITDIKHLYTTNDTWEDTIGKGIYL